MPFMSSKYRLMTPGPVPVPESVLKILALPMEHHRTPEFNLCLARVLKNLKPVFATEEQVFVHTSAGSGAMESAIVNVLSPGDEFICLVSGKFGERWADMVDAFGGISRRIDIKWGESASLELVQAAVEKWPKAKAVLTQACETSSGALHPIEAIAAFLRDTDLLFIVDGITAVGAMPLPMDAWGIDILIGGSQKAFMLPTGISFISLSKKAWRVAETASCPRYYFDLRKERTALKAGETYFSSPVTHLRALDFILQGFFRHGIDRVHARIQALSQATYLAGLACGLESLAANRSPSLSAIRVPDDIDGQKLRADMETKSFVTVMGGQDQLKGRVIRIGHMGAISDADLLATLQALFDGINLQRLEKKSPQTSTKAELISKTKIETALAIAQHELAKAQEIIL
jgi:aspartate aminotransferase-like enzyme